MRGFSEDLTELHDRLEIEDRRPEWLRCPDHAHGSTK